MIVVVMIINNNEILIIGMRTKRTIIKSKVLCSPGFVHDLLPASNLYTNGGRFFNVYTFFA